MRIAPFVLLVLTTAVAADDVLVCGWFSNNVIRCADSGDACETLVTPGSGGLASAHSLEIGPDGNLYVTAFGTNRVLRYELDSGDLIDAFVPAGAGGLSSPTDANFGPDGNLYVTSFGTDCVLAYDGTSGAPLGEFVPSGSGGLINPEAIAFGPDGHLYVLSGVNRNVLKFDGADGSFIEVFVPTGSGDMDDPHFLFFHDDGLLYITAFGNSKVLRFDADDGDFVDVFVGNDPDTPQDESGGLSSAHGAAFGPDGNLYVTSFGNDRVLRYDGTTGAFIDTFLAASAGANGPIDIRFVGPDGPAADLDGDGDVDGADLGLLLGSWGPCGGCPADLDGDGDVDGADLGLLLGSWG